MKFRIAVVTCGAVPFLVWRSKWATPLLITYSLTAVLFGILLVGDYPPKAKSFWPALVIALLHSAIVAGLLMLFFAAPGIGQLPRIAFAFVALIAVLEWRACVWILDFWRAGPGAPPL